VAAVAGVDIAESIRLAEHHPLAALVALAAVHLPTELLERNPVAAAVVHGPAHHPALAALVRSSSLSSRRKERSCQYLL
jgi:hypothetical protein